MALPSPPIAQQGGDIDVDQLYRRIALLESRSQDPSSVAITGGTIGGQAVQKVGVLASMTPPFVQSAISQQMKAINAARASYEDSAAAAFDEQWANLTAWTTAGTPGVQVSGGLLYATAVGGGTNGANHGVSLGAGENLRAVVVYNHLTGDGGGTMLGVSKDAAGGTPTVSGGNAFGIYFQSTQAKVVDTGAISNVAADVGGTAQPALASGQYIVTITVDQTYISVVAFRVSNGEEIRVKRLRSGFSVNNLFVFNSDTRTTTGSSIGRFGARKAISSLLPVATYETVSERVQWSGDGTNDFKLHIPTAYDSRKPLPLVICFHGAGSSENHWAINSNGKAVKDALVAAGYAVLGCTYTGNRATWGSQNSLNAYLAAYNWVRGMYPIGPVAFYANSMGGIESLLSLAERRIPGVVAWVGTSPTANLVSNYANPTFTSSIDSAYGISGGNYATQTSGHDPMLLDASLFRGVPMLFLAATDDTVVSKTDNTDAFAAKVGNYNACTVQAGITGDHNFNFAPYTAQIVSFFASAFAL